MTMSLKELAERIGTATVRVRGDEVAVRGLSAAEVDRIDRLHPAPTPPLRPDPTRGSRAPHVPDHTDAGHQAAVTARNRRVAYAELAAGLNWRTERGLVYDRKASDRDALAYFEAAAEEIASALTTAEVALLKRSQDAVEASGTLAEAARGNSSSTPATSGTRASTPPPPDPDDGPSDTPGPAS